VLEEKQKEVGKSVLGLNKKMIFLLLLKIQLFFSQEGLYFAFTSGIFQSSELNSKSIGFGTLSRCAHLQKNQAFSISSKLLSPGMGRRCSHLGT